MKRATNIEDAITESLSELKTEKLENHEESISWPLKMESYRRAIQIMHNGYDSKSVVEKLIEDYPEVFVLIVDGIKSDETSVKVDGISLSQSEFRTIAEVFSMEGKIEAIKKLKIMTMCGLKEAKDFIDVCMAKGYL